MLEPSSLQNAKTGGMQADLNLTSSDYSLVLSIFFIVGLQWRPMLTLRDICSTRYPAICCSRTIGPPSFSQPLCSSGYVILQGVS